MPPADGFPFGAKSSDMEGASPLQTTQTNLRGWSACRPFPPTARRDASGGKGRSRALYHCTVKKFSRAKGQSATAAAAYRAGAEIEDARTGTVHDYTRRSGVVSSHIIVPDQHPDWSGNRAELWNAAEQKENRKNSVVAREIEIGLPAELSDDARTQLALDYASHIVDRYQVAADVSVHTPSRDGDQRNHHAHILISTRRMDETGFTDKTREIDDKKTGPTEIERMRKDWEVFQNRALERAGEEKRVDCRSLLEQRIEAQERAVEYEELAVAVGGQAAAAWRPSQRESYEKEAESHREKAAELRDQAANLDREPTRHLGPSRTAMQRRFQQRLEQMRDQIKDRSQKLQETYRDKVQSMRSWFDKVAGRLKGHELKMERWEDRRATIETSVERFKGGDISEQRLWHDYEVKDTSDLLAMDEERFDNFAQEHDGITFDNERAAERVRVQAQLDREKHMVSPAEKLERQRQDREKQERERSQGGASAADRLAEMRRKERDREAEDKARREREERSRKDRDRGDLGF